VVRTTVPTPGAIGISGTLMNTKLGYLAVKSVPRITTVKPARLSPAEAHQIEGTVSD